MFSPTKFFTTAIASLAFSAFLLTPFFAAAEEISFSENFSEQVVSRPAGFAVVTGGAATVYISLSMSGVPTNFTGATLLQFSIGDLQFSRSLSNAVNYANGASSVLFVENGTNSSGANIETVRLTASWTKKLLTINGTIRNDFVLAPNFLNSTNPFQQVVSAHLALGELQIVNRPVYCSGKNTILYKRVGSGSTAQEFALDSVQASGAADFTPPTVSVTSLVAGSRIVTTNLLGFSTNIIGIASDNVDVAQVFLKIGTSGFQLVNGTTNWTNAVIPIPGTNTLTFKASDSNGNVSSAQTLKFFYAVNRPLTLTNIGAGSIAGLTNGQLLEIGRGYSVTTKPSAGNLFSHWSGSVTSPLPTLKFLMLSNMVLQANFVPDRFPAAQGTYAGLFAEPSGVGLGTAGLLTIKLTRSGSFSGNLALDGTDYPLSGQFHPGGSAEITIRRSKLPSIKATLVLDFAGGVSGTVYKSGDWTAQFSGFRKAAKSVAGKFTLLIPRNDFSTSAPGGYGFATMTRSTRGDIRVKGTLADGTGFSQSTLVSTNGDWPLFAALYRGNGLLQCAMKFPSETNSDIYGLNLAWIKAATNLVKLYTNGFSLTGPVVGSPYFHPQPLNWTSGSLELGLGNLSAPQTNQVVVGKNNKLTVISTSRISLRLGSNGLLTGGFVHPETGRPTELKGVLLQKPQFGAGFFVGTNESGYFMMQANP